MDGRSLPGTRNGRARLHPRRVNPNARSGDGYDKLRMRSPSAQWKAAPPPSRMPRERPLNLPRRLDWQRIQDSRGDAHDHHRISTRTVLPTYEPQAGGVAFASGREPCDGRHDYSACWTAGQGPSDRSSGSRLQRHLPHARLGRRPRADRPNRDSTLASHNDVTWPTWPPRQAPVEVR